MDQFHNRQHVRLQSRVLGTYLHADHDGERVSLSRRRDSLHTAWAVHIHPRPDGPYLLLHSAAYDRYLGTTFKPAPLGHHGCRTEQRDYDDEPDLMAVMWKTAGAGFADVVLLRNVAGRFLRANGRYLPWNNGVTVDDSVSAMMYWTVEHIPARESPPGIPGPIHTPSPGYHSLMLWRNPVVSRLIRFMPSDPHGPIYTQNCWTPLSMSGTPVNLDELARRIAFVLDGCQSFDLVMCVQAGRQGRLIPLVVDLPSSGYGETLWISAFMSRTQVNLDELARRIAFVLDGRQSFDLVMCVRAGRQGHLTPLVVDLPSSGYGETHWIVVFMSGTPDVADVEMPLHRDYDRVDKSHRVDFAGLPEDIICAIAQCAAKCRCSVLAMRGVCRSWRYAVPAPSQGPLLILSSMRPDQPTLFLAVVAGSILPQRNPLFLPPLGSRCWGSCNGLLCLRVAATTGFTLCPNCGLQYPLPQIEEDINMNNFCETRQLVCAFAANNQATWWTKKGDEENWSGFHHGFGTFPKSIYWDHEGSVACIAAAPSSLIMDMNFEQRILPIPDGLQQELDDLGIELEHPGADIINFILDEDHLLEPWETRGHHVFHAEQDVFMCILLRHTQNRSIHVRLYVFNLDGHIASMIPADDIGNNALFLGGNQAFVTAAGPDLLPNTAYVVDDDGTVRAPRVVRINLSTGQSTIMEYPPDIGPMSSYMPPSWIDPLPVGHCT